MGKLDPLIVKLQVMLTALGVFAGKLGPAVADAKLIVTELAGAASVCFGIGALTSWEYGIIVGGIAVIFAIERQPQVTEKEAAAKALAAKKALLAMKAAGTVQVGVEDVLKAL